MNIYFVTKNQFKINEAQDVLKGFKAETGINLEIHPFSQKLEEILDPELEKIVKYKTLEAYKHLANPCVVEHSGLFMKALPGLPGGIGQIIWDAVQDRMCSFLRQGDSRAATARSIIGYCDGRRVHLYKGETPGHITARARGDYKFNWDPIFIPERSKETYGQMGLKKNVRLPRSQKPGEHFSKRA